MKDKVYLITPLSKDFPVDFEADYIGVDAGFERIEKKGLPLKMAVGDFDSCDLQNVPKEAEIHPVRKNETDTELAIMKAIESGYKTIIVWGGLSGRIDHTYANLMLIGWRFPQVILQDERQKAYVLLPGSYKIKPEYRHLSFFAITDSMISLKNVEYPLDHCPLFPEDIFTCSNGFTEGPAEVTVHKGRIFCMESSFQ